MKMALSFFGMTLPLFCGFAAEEAAVKEPEAPSSKTKAVMTARYISEPIVLDGRLDKAFWKEAEVYELGLADDRAEEGKVLEEPGEVRLAWDEKYLYVGVKYVDSDIVADGTEDQLPHFQLGDLCEIFLRPEGHPWYWELFATPRGKKTTLFWPERDFSRMKEAYRYRADMRVAAYCPGTLNDSSDRDRYWSAEVAIPIAALTERGEAFGPGAKWTILVTRYNYWRNAGDKKPELSTAPRLSKTDYHLLEEYAVLNLVK